MRLLISIILLVIINTGLSGSIVENVEVKGKTSSLKRETADVFIISAKELEDLNISDISGLFAFFSGLDIKRRGPFDTSYDFNMRGSNFEQVMILINGVPFSNPQTGHFNSDIPVCIDDIERVEIVRGGGASSYGSGAFAGSVNFILRDKAPAKIRLIHGRSSLFSLKSSAAFQVSRNISVRGSFKKDYSKGYYENREFDNTLLTTGFKYKFKKGYLNLNSGYVKKDFGAQGFYAPLPSEEKTSAFFTNLILTHKAGEHFDLTYTGSVDTHSDDFILDRTRPAYYRNVTDTDTYMGEIKCTFSRKSLSLAGGMSFKKQKMNSLSLGNRERNISSLFLNSGIKISKTSFDFGLRAESVSDNDVMWLLNCGAGFRLSDSLFIRVSGGRSMRMPSFTELYYDSPSNVGNVNLTPETSISFETSLTYVYGRSTFDIALFYRNQKDLLDWIRTDSHSPWMAVNIDKNSVIGFELRNYLNYRSFSLTSSVEKIFSVNEKDYSVQSKYGLRYADTSIKLNLFSELSERISGSINYCFKTISDSEEQGHFIDISVKCKIGNAGLGIKVDNILDTKIYEIPDVKGYGTWASLFIDYTF